MKLVPELVYAIRKYPGLGSWIHGRDKLCENMQAIVCEFVKYSYRSKIKTAAAKGRVKMGRISPPPSPFVLGNRKQQKRLF